MRQPPPVVPFPQENIYGHFARVEWFSRYLRASDRIAEIGCGTGYRITYPLRVWGFDSVGLDLDESSIHYGRQLFARAGIAPDALLNQRVEELPGEFDVFIASEVLEHVRDGELEQLLQVLWQKLRPGGWLLVTVPNGYGWFEIEAFVWWKLRVGLIMKYTGLAFCISRLKDKIVSGPGYDPIASTLANSPHVQRFTLATIQGRLRRAGFAIEEARGSVGVSGPFSETFLSGAKRIEALNERIGRSLGRFAAGFWIAARKESVAGNESRSI
jgi:SAM-dependent methyltransferase